VKLLPGFSIGESQPVGRSQASSPAFTHCVAMKYDPAFKYVAAALLADFVIALANPACSFLRALWQVASSLGRKAPAETAPHPHPSSAADRLLGAKS
jgi:hypothetical protein